MAGHPPENEDPELDPDEPPNPLPDPELDPLSEPKNFPKNPESLPEDPDEVLPPEPEDLPESEPLLSQEDHSFGVRFLSLSEDPPPIHLDQRLPKRPPSSEPEPRLEGRLVVVLEPPQDEDPEDEEPESEGLKPPLLGPEIK